MIPLAHKLGVWLYRRAENVLAAMLAVMFGAFILQILFRYLLNLPVGWTNELSVVMWIWLVLWGSAFVIRENEEIRFDIFYSGVRRTARRAMFAISAVFLIAFYVISFPAALDYVTFMKVEETAYLDIRFDYLFSIYIAFAVATVVRYTWMTWQVLRGAAPEDFAPTKAGSGV